MNQMPYSVLMSVYKKEQPDYFETAVMSMLQQTEPPDEFVLVCDGPLTDSLDAMIDEFKQNAPHLFHIIRFKENKGLGAALNAGVKACKNALIARMDSDDISVPNRCELQLEAFKKNEKLAFISGVIAEFNAEPTKISGFRRVPLLQEDIFRFSKERNPINHMAVMMKKQAVLAAGNYRAWNGMEDYELWVRMLRYGFQAANLSQVLVLARTGNGFMDRRGGISYARDGILLQIHFLRMGHISKMQFMKNCVVRTMASCIPVGLRSRIYKNVLRNKGCKVNTNESKTI